MYLSIVTSLFGIFFILSGIAGLIPGLFSDNGLLFDIFEVDKIHCVINIIVGIIALFAALKYKRDRMFLQVFGILFGLAAIAGFVWQGNLIVTHFNLADNIFHAAVSIIFLVLGFSASKEGEV